MSSVSAIWRHPIKGLGREQLDRADLTPGQALPFDRHWAVTHNRSRLEGTGWEHCANFLRAASAPQLMAIAARMDGTRVTLTHPDRPEITVDPDTETDALLDWVRPLLPEGREPQGILRATDRGFTDSRTAGVTLCSTASHKALESRLGRALSPHRWRGNIWIDGLVPWEEFDWVGKEVQIGTATLRVYGRTERCRATEANPETGLRDTDTLGLLRELGHQDFSVKAEVIHPGVIEIGSEVHL